MKCLALLCLLTGCLDSIVDDPCEDGYALDANGACVAEAHGPDLVPPGLVAPPGRPDPTMTTPPVDPTIAPPVDPTIVTPDPTLHTPDPIDPTLHTPPPFDPTLATPGEPTWHGDWFCWYGCK